MPQPDLVWLVLDGIKQKYTSKEASDCFEELTFALITLGSIPSRDRTKNEVTLYISDLESTTTEEALESLFGVFGEIEDVRVTHKGNTTFGFVTFKSKESAQKALQNPIELSGHALKVDLAYRKTQNTKKSTVYVNN